MRARLESKVEALKGQKMTFQNDGGVELCLSVPETSDVRNTFLTLVNTVCVQQEQLVMLQSTMKQMAADHAKSQAELIAWTSNCVQELKNQNALLQEQLADSNMQIDNFAYNMQGFVDGSKVDVKTSTSTTTKEIKLTLRPPTVSKTRVPVVTLDCEDESNMKMFYTEGGSESKSSSDAPYTDAAIISTTDAADDVAVSSSDNAEEATIASSSVLASVAVPPVAEAASKKKVKTKPSIAAKMYYGSIRKNRMPVGPVGRWRWAIRKVLRGLRVKALKVGFTTARVEKGSSMLERMERLESDMFTVPLQLKALVRTETDKVAADAKAGLDKLAMQMDAQREDTMKLCESLSTKIGDVRSTCEELDGKIVRLHEIMEENSKKQGAETEEKLESLNRRLLDTESGEAAKLRGRADGLHDQVKGLRASAEEATGRLNAAVLQSQNKAVLALANGGSSEGDGSDPTNSNAGDQLSALLLLDTELRETRRNLSSLETAVFLVAEDVKTLKREITCCSTAAAEGRGEHPPSPRVFSSAEAKNGMLILCVEIEVSVTELLGFLSETNGYWKKHDASLGERWDTLSAVIKASQAVSALSSGLEKLMDEVKGKPSSDTVKTLSQEAATTAVGSAIGPMRTQLRDVEEQVTGLKDTLSAAQNTITSLDMAQKKTSDAITSQDAAIDALKVTTHATDGTVADIAEAVIQLQNRPVAAAAAPEALIIICTREEVAGRGDDDYGGGHGRTNNNKPPKKTGKKTGVTTGDDDLDPDAATDDDGGVYEDNDEDAEGDGDAVDPIVLVKLEEGSDVKVIGGLHRGREGTVVGIIQMSSTSGDNNAVQKYRVQLVPTNHRPTTAAPRKQASALDDQTMQLLRDELAKIEVHLKTMGRDKIDAPSAIKLIKDFMPSAPGVVFEDRGNSAGLAEVEEAIKAVTRELDELRRLQSSELHTVKQELKDSLEAALTAAAPTVPEEEPQTSIITTGQCLGCGRLASMHGNSCVAGTYLGQQRPDSPNLLRGGFRLPVSVRPRSALQTPGVMANPNSSYSLPGGTETTLHTYVHSQPGSPSFTQQLPFHMVESSAFSLGEGPEHNPEAETQLIGDPYIPRYTSVRPKTSSGAFAASQRTSNRGATAAGLKEVGTGVVVKAVRHLQGMDEASGQLRPIRRTGFAGKKSLRAEVSYAPDRYEVQSEYVVPITVPPAGTY